jgi:cysteine-rich repeat protein
MRTFPSRSHWCAAWLVALSACAGGEAIAPSVAVCGDGVRTEPEECDDGNSRSGDGCSSRCDIEAAETPACGNGQLDRGEQCDDGGSVGGDGCGPSCMLEPGWACAGEPSACERIGTGPACGDGVIEAPEACDDNNTDGGDGCSSACAVEDDWSCTGEPSECEEIAVAATCGDGVVSGDEACDDGDTVGGDGCSNLCAVEPGWSCTGEPSACAEDPEPAACGDGRVDDGEACDDGDTVGGDGCSNLCAVEAGWSCAGEPSACTETGAAPVCGNGAIEAGEACDDGDDDGGDGCGPTCAIEDGFTCRGAPSVCTASGLCDGVDCSGLDTACGYGACQATTGDCTFVAHPAGRSCDDGDPCTDGDSCAGGECVAGGALDCSGLSGPCGTGVCDRAAGGCVAVPRDEGASCDSDPADCRTETCVAGACVADTFDDCTPCGPGGAWLCGGGDCFDPRPVTRWDFEDAGLPTGFTGGGSRPWTTTTAQAFDGAQSLRSGAIGASQTSTLTTTVTVARAATVRFQVRISTESCCDFARFLVDGVERYSRAGTLAWTEVRADLTPGTHTLEWRYQKDGSISSGEDAVYIDALQLDGADLCANDGVCGQELDIGGDACVVCASAEVGACDYDGDPCTTGVCAAGRCTETAQPDCSACPGGACYGGACRRTDPVFAGWDFAGDIAEGIATGGDAVWAIVGDAGPDGSNAGRSGAIGNSRSTWMEATVTLPTAGTVSFARRTSTESGYDHLIFAVDGSERGRWSGETAWSSVSYPLAAGTRTLRWTYQKDSSATRGSDAVWVDDIVVSVPDCTAGADCAIPVFTADACLTCPAADGATCATGTCAAGVCAP